METSKVFFNVSIPTVRRSLPTVLHMHGGPSNIQLQTYNPAALAWMDAGFAFMTINYHGSTFFGTEGSGRLTVGWAPSRCRTWREPTAPHTMRCHLRVKARVIHVIRVSFFKGGPTGISLSSRIGHEARAMGSADGIRGHR